MANIKKGILGGLSGTIGNVVGGSWKGIDYLRIKPANVANPNTELQSTQRQKFTLLMKFQQSMNDALRLGFKPYAVKMSAFNAAFRYNYHEALQGTYPNFNIDYAKVLVSHGSLTKAENAAVAATEAGKLTLSWDDNSGNGTAAAGDKALIVIYNEERNESICLLEGALRSEGSMEINVPAAYSGETLHCYLGFSSLSQAIATNSRSKVADSVYAGSLTAL